LSCKRAKGLRPALYKSWAGGVPTSSNFKSQSFRPFMGMEGWLGCGRQMLRIFSSLKNPPNFTSTNDLILCPPKAFNSTILDILLQFFWAEAGVFGSKLQKVTNI